MPATKFGTIKVDKLSVTEIDVPSTNSDNEVGTLKLSDNLEVGGDGLILHDLDDYDFSTANIDLDNGDDDDDNNNDNIVTYSDETTTTVTAVNSNRIITVADSTKSSTSEQNITINGRPYTVIQSGTTITLVDTLKKIISLEAGNLVIATYKSDGTRIDKEIIMDTNNSISEIANGSFDLKVRSLDVTNTTSINETAPSEGCVRIDDTLTVGGAVTLGDATNDDITINGRVASHIVPKTDATYDLGTTTLGFNDLHLGNEGVINLGGGDVTLTHSAGKLTLGGDGAVEFDFANCEMTNVDINSGAIDGVTIGTNSACSSLVATTADINGGTIDNTVIGGETAAAGAFTTLSTSGLLSANAGLTVATGQTLTSNSVNITGGAIEGTVIGSNNNPAAGTFTVLTVNDELVIAAGATIIGDTEGQITLNVEGAPGQTQDIFTVRQNGAVVNKLEVDANGVTTAASLVATTADIQAGTINNTTIGASTAAAGTFTNLTNTPQTINVGGSGITATDNSYTTEPTNSIVYLKATDDSNGSEVTYIWTLDNFTPNEGQMFTIFFNNSADTNVHLKITFGTDGLVTGNGLNDALTFTIHGQSASLVYIDTKWCIINTGAAVS